MKRSEDGFWNPYLCGVLLGGVLYLSFLITGHGLGASGGLARGVTVALKTVAPGTVNTTAFFAHLGGGDKAVLSNWLVWEILGVLVGGAISGLFAGRFRPGDERSRALCSRGQ